MFHKEKYFSENNIYKIGRMFKDEIMDIGWNKAVWDWYNETLLEEARTRPRRHAVGPRAITRDHATPRNSHFFAMIVYDNRVI